MTLPFALPDWVPWWVPLALLVPCLLYALAFVVMPFSVFGLKGRLDALDARLDEIQGEIRSLAMRMPEQAARARFDELYTPPPAGPPTPPQPEPVFTRPPIPPAVRYLDEEPPPDIRVNPPLRHYDTRRDTDARKDGARRIVRPDRTEPRLDWPP